MAPLRRSGRSKVPSKRYSANAFDDLELPESSEDEHAAVATPEEDVANDDDFTMEQVEEDVQDESAGSEEAASDSSGVKTPAMEGDVHEAFEVRENGRVTRQPAQDIVLSGRARSTPESSVLRQSKGETHSRGINLVDNSKGKYDLLKAMFGSHQEDLVPFLLSRDHWFNDLIYPSRHSQEPYGGGLGVYPGFTEEMRTKEATGAWDWYYVEGGRQNFVKRQGKSQLSNVQGALHLPQSSESHRFLMGPYGNQTLHQLRPFEGVDLAQAWRFPTPESCDTPAEQPSLDCSRKGYIFNAGSKVICLDWAPNQSGDDQYLAIGTTIKPPETVKKVSAFEPSEPYKSSIQIWHFSVAALQIPFSRSPALAEVICSEWGSIREFKWCPVQRLNPCMDEENDISLGLLASVWSDGNIRVLDVTIDRSSLRSTSFGTSESPAFPAFSDRRQWSTLQRSQLAHHPQ